MPLTPKEPSRHIRLDGAAARLQLGTGQSFPISQFKRVLVVGTGKAAAPMALRLKE
jgi:glycerate-2-kinase